MNDNKENNEEKTINQANDCDNAGCDPEVDRNPDVEAAEEVIRKAAEAQKEVSPEDKVQEMGEKLAEMNNKYVCLYAEYENYRKRTNQEKADLIINGGKDVVKSILPVVDDMERALQNMTDETAKEGVQLIFNKLISTLQQRGLKEIVCKGEKFDENIHEAIAQIPAADEAMKNTIMDVTEKGYYLNDKILRHPKVVVAI